MRRLGNLGRTHGVMMMQGWRLGSMGPNHADLTTPCLVQLLFLMSSHHRGRPVVIRRVIEESSDVVNEEWIQGFCDLLPVRKIQGAIKRDPDQGQL